MAKTKVAIVRCESYDETAVYNAVKRGIELIGGTNIILDKNKKDEKILLKVNNLAAADPSEAVTTHPSILNAMIKILTEKKVSATHISYGDSPGFDKPSVGLKKSGFTAVAEKYNIKMGDFDNGQIVDYADGVECKKFHIANAVIESDCIISLSKMKTHMLTRVTGAVKNQFGCVHGLNKAAFHVKIPNPINFSKMLVDLNKMLKPKLFIMDGIIAMEGNGPRSGTPVNMNCLIISTDPVAVDTTFCRMINLNPLIVPTIKYGKVMGLGTYLQDEIEYVGDPLESFLNMKFDVIRTPIKENSLKSILPSKLRNMFYSRPAINPDKCVKCGVCVNACPVEGKAINFKNRNKQEPPVYDYTKCIRCYCCQEMCPHKAIYVKH